MEVRDGFIDGLFNYCDRWCETCQLTSWCRLFADVAQAEAAHDPHLKAIAEAAERDAIVEIPPELQKILEEAEDAVSKMAKKEIEEACDHPNEDDPLLARATAYRRMVHGWLRERGDTNDPNDPRSVIAWFSHQIGAKIARALHGLGHEYLDPDEPTDYDGSAKVALLGIDRSRAAWEAIAASEPASPVAGPAIAEMNWLCEEVERMFPRARRFVRPAFDEPDEVARLFAERDAAT